MRVEVRSGQAELRYLGSPGRIRTFNLVVNSHLLCRVELQGKDLVAGKGFEPLTCGL
jgi:hypothetical protein